MKRIALIMMAIAAIAAPAVAQAQSEGYGNVAGAAQEASGEPGAASTSAPTGSVATTGEQSSGVLPFTGLQLALIFGAGVVLIGSGLLLRRARAE